MNSFVIYITESTLLLSVFYLIYLAFLRNSKSFGFTRAYLLGTMLSAILLPLMDISITSGNRIAQQLNTFDAGEFLLNITVEQTIIDQHILETENYFSSEYLILFGYLIGVIVTIILLINQVISITKLILRHQFTLKSNCKISFTELKHAPFSCFNYIFLNKNSIQSQQLHHIMKHEMSHVKHKHTFDLIVHALIAVLHWFNPFIYAYKRSLQEIHEFQVDAHVLKSGTDPLNYQSGLLNQISMNFENALISSFNYSLTKRRIKMMNKKYSKKNIIWKSGVTIAFSMLIATISLINLDGASVKALAIDPDVIPVIKTEKEKTEAFSPIAINDINRISASYGKMKHPITKKMRMHKGIDIAASEGTSVHSFRSGTVRKVSSGENHGKFIIIDHGDGYSSFYSHLSKILVKEGQKINGNDVIGEVGSTGMSTGPHLHFEIKKDNKNMDPAELVPALRK